MGIRILASLSSLLFAVCVCFSPLHAQHAFTISIPDIEVASARSIVQTPDGGFVLLFSRVFYNEEQEADSSLFGLAKLSVDGLLEWSRSVDIGARYAQPVSLLPAEDGGFIALGNVYDQGDTKQDIALLRFNAHGFLVSAKAYDVGLIDEVTDGLLLENGNVMIAGSTKWMEEDNEPEMAEGITIIVDPQGEVLNGNLYPALTDYWFGAYRLRQPNAGTVALIGSIYDTTAYRSPGLTCLMGTDGVVREAFAINPSTYFDKSSITDVVPNRNGGYTMLGNLEMYDCGGPFYSGFMVSCEADGDTLWTRTYSTDQSVSLDCFLPPGGDAYTVVGGVRSYADPRYVFENVNTVGRISDVVSVSPYANGETDEASDYSSDQSSAASCYISTSDGGMAIAGSKRVDRYDEDYNWIGTDHAALVTRLSPDRMPCNGASESVKTDGNSVEFFDANDEATETSEDGLSFAETPVGEDDLPEGSDAESFGEDTTVYEPSADQSEEYEAAEEETIPFVTRLHAPATPIDVAVGTIIVHRTVDFSIEPQVLCRENALATTSSSLRESTADITSSATIVLSPNSLRSGEPVEVAFTLGGREAPEITILTIATGQVVRRIEEGAINWSHMNGRGSASIKTDDLAAGVYLVRVRSVETGQQLTAKLEVR